jgi:hypothetical protein
MDCEQQPPSMTCSHVLKTFSAVRSNFNGIPGIPGVSVPAQLGHVSGFNKVNGESQNLNDHKNPLLACRGARKIHYCLFVMFRPTHLAPNENCRQGELTRV